MIHVVEAHLSEEFICTSIINGVIHSKFSTVINVLFAMPKGRRRLITIITQATKGIPDSITVTDEFFDSLSLLSLGTKVASSNLIFNFGTNTELLKVDFSSLRSSNITVENYRVSTELINFFRYPKVLKNFYDDLNYEDKYLDISYIKKKEISWNLERFARAWVDNDFIQMETILLHYVGMGIGLTPSCDDAFIGIIALFTGAKYFADKNNAVNSCLGKWKELTEIERLSSFENLLFNRTTDVSLKYLCCSQEGRFSEPVNDLIRIIYSETEVGLELCIKSVSEVGGSSGIDTLLGMEIACKVLGELMS